jgi:hypothetical protein
MSVCCLCVCSFQSDGALECGELRYAVTLAAEVAEQHPIDLVTALPLPPLIACESPREFDAGTPLALPVAQ